MRRLNSQFTTKYLSEAGTRPENKDYFGFVEMEDGDADAAIEKLDNSSFGGRTLRVNEAKPRAPRQPRY